MTKDWYSFGPRLCSAPRREERRHSASKARVNALLAASGERGVLNRPLAWRISNNAKVGTVPVRDLEDLHARDPDFHDFRRHLHGAGRGLAGARAVFGGGAL